MQRMMCRYRRDETATELGQGELRKYFLAALVSAELSDDEQRRAVTLGPSLPSGATSVDERCVIELLTPRDPTDVRQLLNAHLPEGVVIERAWITQPGTADEQLSHLDEAVYHMIWQPAPPTDELILRIRHFLAADAVPFTRRREHKTQQLNARALVREVQLLAWRGEALRLQIVVSVGSQGSLRPEEFLHVLGYVVPDGAVQVCRVALLQSAWRRPYDAQAHHRWRRTQI